MIFVMYSCFSLFRRSITRIKDTGLSKTDVSQERKAMAAVQKETLIKESKHETQEKSSSSDSDSDSEGETSESSEEPSDEKENQRRAMSEKLAPKRGSETDSESEKNQAVTNSVKNQAVVNNVRGRISPYSRLDNKNIVSTATTNTTSGRNVNTTATSRFTSAVNRQPPAAVEKKEETRPSDRFQSKPATNKVEFTRGRINSNQEAAEPRDLDSRRKMFESSRSTSGSRTSRLNSEDGKSAKQDEGKDRVEAKTNEGNTKNTKEEVSKFYIDSLIGN